MSGPAPGAGGEKAETPGHLRNRPNLRPCELPPGPRAQAPALPSSFQKRGLGRKASWLLSGSCKIAFDELSVNKREPDGLGFGKSAHGPYLELGAQALPDPGRAPCCRRCRRRRAGGAPAVSRGLSTSCLVSSWASPGAPDPPAGRLCAEDTGSLVTALT